MPSLIVLIVLLALVVAIFAAAGRANGNIATVLLAIAMLLQVYR